MTSDAAQIHITMSKWSSASLNAAECTSTFAGGGCTGHAQHRLDRSRQPIQGQQQGGAGGTLKICVRTQAPSTEEMESQVSRTANAASESFSRYLPARRPQHTSCAADMAAAFILINAWQRAGGGSVQGRDGGGLKDLVERERAAVEQADEARIAAVTRRE